MGSAPRRYAVTRANQGHFLARQLQIVFNHRLHQSLEADLGLPSERPPRLAGVALQRIHFGGPEIAGIFFDAGWICSSRCRRRAAFAKSP